MKTRWMLGLFAAAALSAAPIQVVVDTTALNTQTGTIEIQFNPGSFPAVYESGTATVTLFNLGAGSLGSVASALSGGGSGSLPGPLQLINSSFYNGIVYNATFGTTATFSVDFAGNVFLTPGQSILSSFSVTFNGTTSLVAVADLLGGGLIDSSFSSPGVTFNAVPEPSTFALLGLGLAVVMAARRLAQPWAP